MGGLALQFPAWLHSSLSIWTELYCCAAKKTDERPPERPPASHLPVPQDRILGGPHPHVTVRSLSGKILYCKLTTRQMLVDACHIPELSHDLLRGQIFILILP